MAQIKNKRFSKGRKVPRTINTPLNRFIAVIIFCTLSWTYWLLTGVDEDNSTLKDTEYITPKFNKENWPAQELSNHQLATIAQDVSLERLRTMLDPILIPRVPGTKNSSKVISHIVNELTVLDDWTITYDTFYDTPPPPYDQKIKFKTIIATHNPQAERRLVLACHHDSKVTPEGFIGATDSAVPCAMLLEVANALKDALKAQKDFVPDVTLQLLFLDGEEAFVQWTATDSVYGARHLAKKWKKNGKLDDIDLFVLLDLLGSEDTLIRDYHITKTRWFKHVAELERTMTSLGVLPAHTAVFQSHPRFNMYQIDDDHMPFFKRGVPVFHVVSAPFPTVWHKIGDDESCLDYPRIDIITKIITCFTAQYLHLPIG